MLAWNSSVYYVADIRGIYTARTNITIREVGSQIVIYVASFSCVIYCVLVFIYEINLWWLTSWTMIERDFPRVDKDLLRPYAQIRTGSQGHIYTEYCIVYRCDPRIPSLV